LRQEEPLELPVVVMPCLNEEETLATCIRKAQRAIADANIAGEVIVADNSTDRSIEIAEQLGARVVHVNAKGYGNALMSGIAASRGKFIVMGCRRQLRLWPHPTER
jgi:glycosyltransferase involved in cell wall biosynthesis